MNHNYFKINNIFITLLIFYIGFIGFVLTLEINLILKFSFVLNLVPILSLTYYYLNFQTFSIANGAVIIFFFLFYFLAPVLQLDSDSNMLLNTVKCSNNLLLLSNLYVFIFMSIYFITLILLNKSRIKIKVHSIDFQKIKILPILIILSIVISQKAFSEMTTIFSTLQNEFEIDSNERIMVMFERKVMNMIPFVTLSAFVITERRNTYLVLIFAILLICIFLTKNPLLDRRNALGPIYISLLILMFKDYFTKNIRIFTLFFIMMVIFFPLTSLLTHTVVGSWQEQSINYTELIKNHFIDLHYDAWANIAASINYVERNGFSFGNQLLGSLSFWFPRSLWENKPISTGELLGNFLMQFETLHFNNISATIVVEGYIDFGFVGVIIYGILLALFTSKLDRMYSEGDVFSKIFTVYSSVFLFFILRGALMPAVAYLFGAWLSIIILPNAIVTICTINFKSEWKSIKKL